MVSTLSPRPTGTPAPTRDAADPLSVGLDLRLRLASEYLWGNLAAYGTTAAGWGWVPDVAPNPQNTAEVVCALTLLSEDLGGRPDVEEFVRLESVHHPTGADWEFTAVVDVAWRLRALRALGRPPTDATAAAGVRFLVATQDPDTGGWRLSGTTGPVSVTATSAAVLALLGLEGDDEREAVRRGAAMLTTAMLDADPRAEEDYAAAQIAFVLSQPRIAGVGGPRVEKALEAAVERVTGYLAGQRYAVQEERFLRGTVLDTWRHLTLYQSISALAVAAPDRVTSPEFRHALLRLLELQEMREGSPNRGGFHTSAEGFVTTYATTQGIEAVRLVREALAHRVNPASVLDLICRSSGSHHTDPQLIARARGTDYVVNSPAAAVVMVVSVLAGLTVATLAAVTRDLIHPVAARLLIVWGALLVASGASVYLAARLTAVPNGRIFAGVFTVLTALALPIITFVIA